MCALSLLPDALIGYTGLVGGTLDRSGWQFGSRFNSRNIAEMRGREFDTVVCAGVSAVKWRANLDPGGDWAGIAALWEVLTTVRARRVLLVSTVDVYPRPIGVTEADAPPRGEGDAYGRNRLELELLVAQRFEHHTIIRLPALFGEGLKKNAIFDLLTGNLTDRIPPAAVMQWYPLRRFAEDARRAMTANIRLINFTVAPICIKDIAARFFPHMALGPEGLPAPQYDVRTLHADLLGGTGEYHLGAAQVIDELETYVSWVRATGKP